jgi:hypothetical protein
MNRTHLLIIATTAALGLVATAACAADTGGQRIVSRKGNCQMTVPSDWKVDATIKISAAAVDGKTLGMVFDSPQTLGAMKSFVMQAMKPTRVFEDTAQRLWFQHEQHSIGPDTRWYAAVPGKTGVCGVRMSVGSPAMADTLKKIVMSVGPAS